MSMIGQGSLMIWSFLQMFILCQFGEMVNSSFADLNDEFYQLDWYSFPSEFQRMLPTLLMNAQQEVVIKGFLNVLCTRETFKKVNSVFAT